MTGRRNITSSQREAEELLRRTRKRLIATGSETAEAMLRSGNYHYLVGGQVFVEMDEQGVEGLHDVKAHWLPLIFKNGKFEQFGTGLEDGIGHDKLSHRWILVN